VVVAMVVVAMVVVAMVVVAMVVVAMVVVAMAVGTAKKDGPKDLRFLLPAWPDRNHLMKMQLDFMIEHTT
jgi:hypothetical protein